MIFEYDLYGLDVFDKSEVKTILNHVRDHIIAHLREQEEKDSCGAAQISAHEIKKYLHTTIDLCIKRDIVGISERITQNISQA